MGSGGQVAHQPTTAGRFPALPAMFHRARTLAHVAGDGQLFTGRGVDGDEMADPVLAGWPTSSDGGPDDGAEKWLLADQATVGPFLSHLRQIGQLALRHQQIDDLRIEPVDPQDQNPSPGRVGATSCGYNEHKRAQYGA